MKKLSLNVDELKVDSFDSTSAALLDDGTIRGFDSTYDDATCFGGSCRRGTNCNVCPSLATLCYAAEAAD